MPNAAACTLLSLGLRHSEFLRPWSFGIRHFSHLHLLRSEAAASLANQMIQGVQNIFSASERRGDVRARRRGKLEGRLLNPSARFVAIESDDALAVWLAHL